MPARSIQMLAIVFWVALGWLATAATPVAAQRVADRRVEAENAAAGGGATVNLPHVVPGGDGQQWMIQRGGWLQQQGNMPVFAQAAMLNINGAGPQGNANRATQDKQSGELVIDGLQIGGLALTRRVLINREENYVRYIDVLRNRGGGEQVINLTLQTSLNFGVNGGNVVADPKKASANLGWVAATGAGPVVAEVWAGRGAKVTPDVNWQPGNSFVQAVYRLPIPADGQAAIMHLHALVPGEEAGEQFTLGIRESKLLANVPADVRKAIVNFRVGGSFMGDVEILRGDALDVVELRTGDQLRGTLRAPSYAIKSTFGRIELPAERVVGVVNTGAFRQRQLLVTGEGEMIGGTLQAESVAIQLSSGQTTSVPLSQVARVGYRKRPGEPEELAATRAMLWLRTGDRLGVDPPAEAIPVLTRFGSIRVPPEKLASADLRSTDSAVHVLTLTDGSRFGGLVQAEQLNLKLAATGQPVTVPVSWIAALQLATPTGDDDGAAAAPEAVEGGNAESEARLSLAGGDVLAGPIVGQVQLDTLFDTLTINADEVVRLAPVDADPSAGPPGGSGGAGGDVQVTLWDQTVVSGQLRDGSVRCSLAGGAIEVTVPLPLVESYEQPNPRPSEAMVGRIRDLVGSLSADDFSVREQAEQQLVSLGRVVAPLLKEWRDAQPLEAQQRIDTILKQVQAKK